MQHSFNIYYAQRYGLTEAVLINNFQFWIGKNRANKSHQYDERTWTYNSVKAFEELFPYLKSSQIRRGLESLVDQKVLIKGEYNKTPYDRTSWYAFLDESAFLNNQLDLSNLTNGNAGNDNSIPDSKPDEQEKTSKKKEFIPPSEEEVVAFFKKNGYPEAQARKAFAHYNNFGWKDSRGTKVKNWQQKMQTNWFKGTPDQSQITALDGETRMMAFFEKGYTSCTKDELKWIYEWQHRAPAIHLKYPNNVRLVRADSPLTKQDAIDADRAAGY